MTETASADRTASRRQWARSILIIDVLAVVHIMVAIAASLIALLFMTPLAETTDTGSMHFPIMWAVQLAIAVPVLAFLLTRDHWLIKKLVRPVFQGFILILPAACLALALEIAWKSVAAVPEGLAVPVTGAAAIAAVVAAALANRVIVHDAVMIVTVTIFSAVLGVVVGPVPCMAFLGAMLVLDAIEVYVSKHMIAMFEGMIGVRLIPLLIVPPTLAGLLDRPPVAIDREEDGIRTIYLGLGDIGIPSLLFVSSIMFFPGAGPAIGTLIGIFAGYRVLGYMIQNGKPHAGLPPIAGGALIGCVLGAVLTGVPLW